MSKYNVVLIPGKPREMKRASILIHETTAAQIKNAMSVDIIDITTIEEYVKKNVDFEKIKPSVVNQL